MPRINEMDGFKKSLRALVSFQDEKGQEQLCWKSCRIILDTIRAAYDFSGEFEVSDKIQRRNDIAVAFLHRFDALELYGDRAAQTFNKIVDRNTVGMMALAIAFIRGLGAAEINNMIDNPRLATAPVFGLRVIYMSMQQFIRPSKVDDYMLALKLQIEPMPPHRSKDAPGPTSPTRG